MQVVPGVKEPPKLGVAPSGVPCAEPGCAGGQARPALPLRSLEPPGVRPTVARSARPGTARPAPPTPRQDPAACLQYNGITVLVYCYVTH